MKETKFINFLFTMLPSRIACKEENKPSYTTTSSHFFSRIKGKVEEGDVDRFQEFVKCKNWKKKQLRAGLRNSEIKAKWNKGRETNKGKKKILDRLKCKF